MDERGKSERPCQLYRHFDAEGRLLYVGISASAAARLAEHGVKTWFREIARIEVENLPTRAAALMAEKLAIRTERPLHNIALMVPASAAPQAGIRIRWAKSAKLLVEELEGRPFADCA